DPARWMEFVPRNVYLSEISIPSSWNTIEPSAQDIVAGATPTKEGENTIKDQYEKGCRGFHFDCRYKWTPDIKQVEEEYQVQVNHDTDGYQGPIIFHKDYCHACHVYRGKNVKHDPSELTTLDETDPIYITKTHIVDKDEGYATLGVVQGKPFYLVSSGEYKNCYFMNQSNITFAEAMNAIIANVKENEYMVLTCTWAHGSTDPITKSTSAVNPYKWFHDISEICANNTKVFDASNITPETTVGEVLGKIIVIVNCEGAVSEHVLPTSSKCLFVNMPQARTEAMYAHGYMSNEHLYKFNKSQSGVKIANTLAQICSYNDSPILTTNRGYAPTFLQADAQREKVGQTILDWSAAQFASLTYAHDTWQFQGLGGYTVDNDQSHSGGSGYVGVASVLNNWIDGRIANMKVSPGTGESIFHPIGLIYMNMVTREQPDDATYPINGPKTCKNILELNNKFQKKFDASKPAWPEQGATVRSAAPGYSSGV
ncbi:MAG: hypothetical protein HUJ98_13595, partial [Bacteroidaceae bacterium]|nr:hypothetical protein [Bacteroidaceae bacterium]